MNADSASPESLPSLIDKATSGYDLAIGSRLYRHSGAVVGSPPMRRFISYAANWLAHKILGVTAMDCTARLSLLPARGVLNDRPRPDF